MTIGSVLLVCIGGSICAATWREADTVWEFVIAFCIGAALVHWGLS